MSIHIWVYMSIYECIVGYVVLAVSKDLAELDKILTTGHYNIAYTHCVGTHFILYARINLVSLQEILIL